MTTKLSARVKFRGDLTLDQISKIVSDFAASCAKAHAREVSVVVQE